MKNSFQRLDRGLRIAWNIDNQAGAQSAGNSAAHGGKRSIFQSLAAHMFSESIQDALAYRTRRLRRNVAEGDTGASGGNHQPRLLGLLPYCERNPRHVVGDNLTSIHIKTGLPEAVDDGGSGTIDTQAAGAGVAYGNDGGVHICDSTFSGNHTDVGTRVCKE